MWMENKGLKNKGNRQPSYAWFLFWLTLLDGCQEFELTLKYLFTFGWKEYERYKNTQKRDLLKGRNPDKPITLVTVKPNAWFSSENGKIRFLSG